MVLHHGGFPIRKSTDQSPFAAPRSLSQLVTSFVGSWCQGIHLMLFFAWTSFFRFSLSFELLEFLTNVRDIARERFSLHTFSSLHFHFREIVFTLTGKTYFRILKSVLLSVRFYSFFQYTSYSVFNEHFADHSVICFRELALRSLLP